MNPKIYITRAGVTRVENKKAKDQFLEKRIHKYDEWIEKK